jgi:hypothetical protein
MTAACVTANEINAGRKREGEITVMNKIRVHRNKGEAKQQR